MWDDRDVRCGRTVMAWMAASAAAMTGERWLGPRYRECVAQVEAALALSAHGDFRRGGRDEVAEQQGVV